MRRKAVLFTAGVLTGALLLGTACGGGGQEENVPPPKIDVQASAYENPDAVLSLSGDLDVSTKSKQISSELFGIFLEDINYASYALDGNLVANGSFENAKSKTYAWKADGATLAVTTADSLFKGKTAFGSVNPTAARVGIASAGGSISNSGYVPVPIAVKKGIAYSFSAFIKATDYSGDIEIAVVNGSTEYAKATVSVTKSEEWVKYGATLTATESASEGLSLKLTFKGTGELLIDNVALDTHDATDGIKNYIFNAIKDLSPAFVRFPGGCIIEGLSDDGFFDWKNSIGATTVSAGGVADTVPEFTYTQVIDGKSSQKTTRGERATRTPNIDIWQNSANDQWHEQGSANYAMEYGIGFYEYFLLCENLGASAIPIVNCGLGCQGQSNPVGAGVRLSGRHGKGINDFIQDAKDLICFAKGKVGAEDPNEAYWAKVRSDMGHPEPFKMDYIGIGNEQWDSYYTLYYEKFLNAFALESNPIYTSVKPIVGNCTLMANCENPAENRDGAALSAAKRYQKGGNIQNVSEYGVVDQHYYMNYTDFLAAATDNFYKDYTRPVDGNERYTKQDDSRYYEVFVGEYSANNQDMHYPDWDQSKKGTFTANSWITALSEAAMMTTYEENGDIIRLAAYAPMFGNLNMKYTQWPVNMMFYNNTDLVLTPNYFVQQLFMKNAGDHKIDAAIEFTSGETPQTKYVKPINRMVNDIYYVVSADEETGDIIIKIVNAGKNEFNFNISLEDLNLTNKGYASVTSLVGNTPTDVSNLKETAVSPDTYTIGNFTGNVAGFNVQPYSVSAIRVHTK